ncbi:MULTISPECIES: ABC transporter permease [Phocaeicola]|uniref:ABC transporter permease n=1 Tax=Phocaeicola TaxID=909656 RepID=UPI001F163DB0|nr:MULTISPECIES: ABC transporter permease [Phocaeicola]MCE9379175.1 ABC transporter permease [Phocaeicola vulgatus]
MIRVFGNLVYYRIVEYLHVKQAVFFSIIFPTFLFVIMASLWGDTNMYYSNFILSGVIGMTIASEGIFSIGQSIKRFYMTGMIKYIRKMPFSVLFYMASIVVAKIINLIFIFALMYAVGVLFFDCSLTLTDITNAISGLFIGLTMFSCIGLVLYFINIRVESEKSIVHIIYLLIIFVSNVFYAVGDLSQTINLLGNFLPLNSILNIIRNGEYSWSILPWIIIPMVTFTVLIKKIETKR